MAAAPRTRAAATALLAAAGIDWTAPAVDVDDVLYDAGWPEPAREHALRWLQ